MNTSTPNSLFSNRLVQLALLVVCFGAVFMLGYHILNFENSNLYKPHKASTPDPWPSITSVLGNNIQNVSFPSGSENTSGGASGVMLNAAYSPAPKASHKGTVILSHGNAGHIGTRVHIMDSLIRHGYGVLMYDYQGYGLSEGTPSESRLYDNLKAASDYLINTHHIPITHQIAMGESLGCAVTVHVAQHRPFKAVVLLAPFTSIPEMAQVVYPNIPLQWIITQPFDSLSKITSLTSPLIIAHGQQDETVPHAMGKALFDKVNASTPKKWISVPDAGHNTLYEKVEPQLMATLAEMLQTSSDEI